jgi:hypothetical protein
LDGKQQKFIGQLFTGGIEVDEFTQLDSLSDSVAIARPEFDGIHDAPPRHAKDTMLRLLSTFPQRRYQHSSLAKGRATALDGEPATMPAPCLPAA